MEGVTLSHTQPSKTPKKRPTPLPPIRRPLSFTAIPHVPPPPPKGASPRSIYTHLQHSGGGLPPSSICEEDPPSAAHEHVRYMGVIEGQHTCMTAQRAAAGGNGAQANSHTHKGEPVLTASPRAHTHAHDAVVRTHNATASMPTPPPMPTHDDQEDTLQYSQLYQTQFSYVSPPLISKRVNEALHGKPPLQPSRRNLDF